MIKQTKLVNHHSVVLNWNNEIKISNPKVLVLGSFNPYFKEGKVVDYYYGRKSNHFWQVIAELIGEPSDYFFDVNAGLKRKKEVMKDRFMCMDVIDSLEFTSDDMNIIDNYIDNEIKKNFADQKIWRSNTQNQKLQISRKYNSEILNILKSTPSIKTVIHTIGGSNLNENTISPKEKKLGSEGFESFINKIENTCKEKNIDFIKTPLSPSDYAIKNGSTNRNDLKAFIKTHLEL